MINRFLETGRFISPELITKYGNSIENTYQTLRNSDIIDGFSKWSNDVPLGHRPKLIECSNSCKNLCEALAKPTVVEQLNNAAEQLVKSNSFLEKLIKKITEVNEILKSNPKLSADYVKARDAFRQKKAQLTNLIKKKGNNKTENKDNPDKHKI